MDQNKNLYFIPIIAKAFESPNPVDSMYDAIIEITSLGKLEEYKEGYEYFRKFIGEGMTTQILDKDNHEMLLDKIIVKILSDDIDVSEEKKRGYRDKIKNNPVLFKRYEKIFEEYFKQIPLEIEIYKEGNKISSQSIKKDSKDVIFRDIDPGNYIIGLSNGRQLWEGEITKEDVIWEEAFPGKNYPMAADTGEGMIQSTRTEQIISGEITLSLYAGLESGKIVVTLN
jgi:hypothetical protein